MVSDGLLDPREKGDHTSSNLGLADRGEMRLTAPDDDNDDVIAEATLCRVCAPIFSENSYERWSKVWQYRGRTRGDSSKSDSFPLVGQHHRSLRSMRDSTDQCCYICTRLHKNEESDSRSRFPLHYHLRILPQDGETAKTIYRLEISDVKFDIQPDDPASALQQLASRSRCRPWTGHNDIAQVAKCWLGECLTNHDSCSKSSPDTWRPSRLLDISEDKIKLVSGNSEDVRHHLYVTLSHCWGTRRFPVLTVTSLPRYREGVHISEFELTFQETITTVRRLGLRYLWIDCYCIIQGSNDEAVKDWEYESLRMGDVYARGLLNIAAAESAGPAHGLFRTREPHSVNGRIFWAPTQEQSRGLFYITLAPLSDDRDEPRLSPLMKRGWVLQECVLAPRMLYFAHDGVHWQCTQLAASDSNPEGEGGEFISTPGRQGWLRLNPFWTLGNSGIARQRYPDHIKDTWIGVLGHYCGSQLTYPEKDLFAALAGIGAKLAELSGGVFKYGMLESTFPESLLFYCEGQGRPAEPREDRPTWHWSLSYPRVSHMLVDMIYRGGLWEKRPFFPMAYTFMSNDCRPLPGKHARDFWPNIFLIGRLLTELPSRGRHYDTAEYRASPPTEGMSYVPLINTRSDKQGAVVSIIYGLILVQSKSGAYRRIGVWQSLSSDHDIHTRTRKTSPRLILLE